MRDLDPSERRREGLSAPHPASLPLELLRKDCALEAGHAGGPGGQHRNRVATAVRIVHKPSGLVGRASERRRRIENERVAWRRLRLALAVGVRVPWERPSETWNGRVKGGRVVVSERSDDFPRMIAEALDALAASGWDARAAAGSLGTSTSSLLRLVRRHGAANAVWNGERQARAAARASERANADERPPGSTA